LRQKVISLCTLLCLVILALLAVTCWAARHDLCVLMFWACFHL
jgi:hypothetical protein